MLGVQILTQDQHKKPRMQEERRSYKSLGIM